jgi:Flp pilus assembly pilin Flp
VKGDLYVKLVKRFWQEETGAETVEYALVLGLVALAAVAGLTLAGSNIKSWWNGLASEISSIPT